MKYDFDRVMVARSSDSLKWGKVECMFGGKNVLPMWIADMDFPVASPITEALKTRIEYEIYGYTFPSLSLIEAVVDRMQRNYDWKIKPEWVVFTPGVTPALHAAVKAFACPGDDVIVQEPVYYPFFPAIRNNGCHIANNQLRLINGRYEIDFDELEGKFNPKAGMMPSASRARMMILCSPHNPVGRVWTREELIRMGEIILRNNAVMVSDEIHCELLFKGSKHIPFASISREFEQSSVICMAPSKTFNLAGFHASSIIIPNDELRSKFAEASDGIMSSVNILGLTAMEAAYRNGDEWLEQLLSYIQGNLEFLMQYLKEKIPKIRAIKPEGTYLVWLDCRELGLNSMNLRAFMREKARVGVDDGFLFGSSGDGFQRINIACPRSILEEALKRIEKAVNDY